MLTEDSLFAGALNNEYEAALQYGEAIHVGVKCMWRLPPRRVISFGYAGALAYGFSIGDIVEATKVVDRKGNLIGHCRRFGYPGAKEVTVLASGSYIGCTKRRLELCENSGAHVVDMETGVYAKRGLLDSYLRVVSDTPEMPLGVLDFMRSLKPGFKAYDTLWSLKI